MKTIKINNNGTDFTLAYNRESIIKLDDMGFDITQVEKISTKQIQILYRGAFLMYHPTVSRKVMDDIYEGIENKQGFLSKLIEMFSEAFNTLFDDPKDDSKKVEWEANF